MCLSLQSHRSTARLGLYYYNSFDINNVVYVALKWYCNFGYKSNGGEKEEGKKGKDQHLGSSNVQECD